MKCDMCGKNEAIIHVQQISNGELKEIHLCASCAGKSGIVATDGNNAALDLGNLLGDALGTLFAENKGGHENFPECCPSCGTTADEIKENGKVGCPDCYSQFHSLIQAMQEREMTPAAYRGKIPKRLKTFKACLIDKALLQSQLEEAVAGEEYERAARLRDAISRIENGL